MDMISRIRAQYDQMVRDRRHLHAHPELSTKEENTLRYIENALHETGIETRRVVPGGVLGVINPGRAGRTVLLRADVDALAIAESAVNLKGPKACVSQIPGVMHACGHDAHAAMILAAARALHDMREELPGQVVLFFEQSEEIGGRLLQVAQELESSSLRPDICYGAHVRWDLPSGKIAVLDGAAMAGGFGFDVTLQGRGGHGSRPDLARSPVDCFAAIHTHIQQMRLTRVAPDQVLTYSVGTLESGGTHNIIPETLRFAGTVRSFDVDGACEAFAAKMREDIEQIAALHGCTAVFNRYTRPIYETRNTPGVAQMARAAVKKYVDAQALTEGSPWMASESMNVLLRLYGGVLAFVGIRNEALGTGANHHTPLFDVDEQAMIPGAAAAAAFALEALTCEKLPSFARKIVSLEDLTSRTI